MSTTSPRKVIGIGRPIPSTDLPDFAQAARFLTLLDETAERWTFQTFDDNKDRKDPAFAKVLHGTLKEHFEELCRLSALGAGVFLTVNETNGRGRKVADIIRVRAVFQEADRPGTPEPPLQPHLVVESSPGKYHRYLLVEGGHRFDLFEQVMARLVMDFGSDPNAKDRARVLRLPGFPHQKDPANPRRVRVIHESGERPYSWEEITAAIPPLLIKKKTADIPPGTGIDDPVKVRSALAALNPDMEYLPWLQVGMALHHASAGGAEGLALWDEWSARGSLYRPGETAYKWSSFGNTNGRPVTLATVFKLASDTGWRWKDLAKGNGHDDAPLSDYSDYPEAHGYEKDKAAFGPESPGANSDKAPPSPLSLIQFTIDQVMSLPPEPRFIIRGFMPVDVAAIIGTGGVGKSTLWLFQLIHIILELPLWGMEIEQTGIVIYVTAEDDVTRIHWRLVNIIEQMGLTRAQRQQVISKFCIIDLVGSGRRLAQLDRDQNIFITRLATEISDLIAPMGPVIASFDPFVKFGPGERFTNDGEDAVVNALMRIRKAVGCAAFAIHHPSKAVAQTGAVSHHAGRGGAALGDGVRGAYQMLTLTIEIAKEKYSDLARMYPDDIAQGRLLAYHVTKLSDDIKPAEPLILRRTGWVFDLVDAPTREKVAERTRQQQEDSARQNLNALLAFLQARSMDNYGKPELEHMYAEIGIKRNHVRAAIARGLGTGLLREQEAPRDGSKTGPGKVVIKPTDWSKE